MKNKTYEETIYTSKLNCNRYECVKNMLHEFKNFYMFKKNSPLKEYLQTKKVMLTKYFSFYQIYSQMQKIIENEMLRDSTNPIIILCNTDLEKVFNTSLLHDNELFKHIFSHLIKVSNEMQPLLHDIFKTRTKKQKAKALKLLKEDIESIHCKRNVPCCILRDPRYRYKISFKLRIVLNKLSNFSNDQMYFTWNEICNYLSQYILQRRNFLFDKRNIGIAFVKYDILGYVFGVQAFHRYQVTKLLSQHIIAENP
jgi:SWIB/MDM2 domain